jgi:hypothetical protein
MSSQIGICIKCGKKGKVQQHHSKGYLPPFEDYTQPYCQSCDITAHNKALKTGRCLLKPFERSKLSKNSYFRRILKPKLDEIKQNYKKATLC